MTENCANNVESGEDRRGNDCIASNTDIKSACERICKKLARGTVLRLQRIRVQTISGFRKAMLGIAMARVDYNLVATLLKSNSSINNQPLGASDSQVGMQKDNGLGFLVICHSTNSMAHIASSWMLWWEVIAGLPKVHMCASTSKLSSESATESNVSSNREGPPLWERATQPYIIGAPGIGT